MFRKCLAFLFAFSLTLAFSTAVSAKAKSKNKSFTNGTRAKYPALQNELLAMRVLREIYAAQATYFLTVGTGSLGYGRFGNAMQLFNENLIDADTASGVKYGYVFSINEVLGQGYTRFVATATPHRYGKTGKRSFYIDSACKLRGVNKFGRTADANAPLIETCTPTIAYENERRTIAAMRTLHTAQISYRASDAGGNFGTLTQLFQAGLIDSVVAGGAYAGYNFTMVVIAQNPFQPAFYYSQSIPRIYGESGFRSFYVDVNGIIRGADKRGAGADTTDPPVDGAASEQTEN